MPLTTLNIEVEIDDTFQNGNKIDLERFYDVVNAAAATEYERQVQANRIQFKMRMRTTNLDNMADVLELHGDQVADETATG
jgi:hypothetical protein